MSLADADLEQLRRVTFVRTVEYHREIASTNTRALYLAEDPAVELPALVLADRQTAGRGRGSHEWWSAPGALTFSLILPRVDAADAVTWPQISLTAGLAISDALQQLRPGLDIGLKWPNDVFVQSRKICGILVEVSPRCPQRQVMGIGINVNNSVTRAPPPVASTAISLIDVTGYPFDLMIVLVRVLQQLAPQLSALAHAGTALASRWHALCMLTGQEIRIDAGPRTTTGRCQGIDESGALLVDTVQGRARCTSGVVTLLETRESRHRA